MSTKTLDVSFNVSGVCSQTIRLNDNCPLSHSEIIECLNGKGDHLLSTTPNHGGELILIESIKEGKFTVIGKITECEVSGDYSDFEEEDWSLHCKSNSKSNQT